MVNNHSEVHGKTRISTSCLEVSYIEFKFYVGGMQFCEVEGIYAGHVFEWIFSTAGKKSKYTDTWTGDQPSPALNVEY